MKILIVEDDFTSRIIMQEFLKGYGEVHITVNGKEAIEAVNLSLELGAPYALICLDVMMPEMDGQTALRHIRDMEASRGILSTDGAKIIMTTALGDVKNAMSAFHNLCDAYLVKPIDRAKLLEALRKLGLIQ